MQEMLHLEQYGTLRVLFVSLLLGIVAGLVVVVLSAVPKAWCGGHPSLSFCSVVLESETVCCSVACVAATSVAFFLFLTSGTRSGPGVSVTLSVASVRSRVAPSRILCSDVSPVLFRRSVSHLDLTVPFLFAHGLLRMPCSSSIRTKQRKKKEDNGKWCVCEGSLLLVYIQRAGSIYIYIQHPAHVFCFRKKKNKHCVIFIVVDKNLMYKRNKCSQLLYQRYA